MDFPGGDPAGGDDGGRRRPRRRGVSQARLIGDKLTNALGQQVIVDNRPGAGGTIGVDLAAKGPPDGHTIVLASFGNILVGPSLYKKLPYDPVEDLDPVVLVSEPPATRDWLSRMLEVHRLRLSGGLGQQLMRGWPTSY